MGGEIIYSFGDTRNWQHGTELCDCRVHHYGKEQHFYTAIRIPQMNNSFLIG